MVPVEPKPKKGAAKAKPAKRQSGGVMEFFFGLLVGVVGTFLVMVFFAPKPRPALESRAEMPLVMPTARPLTIEDYRRAYPDEASSPE
jgi:hypothetical protein